MKNIGKITRFSLTKMYCLSLFLFIFSNLSAQSDSTYTLLTNSRTSCGVYKGDRLVRTLWSNKNQQAGTYYVNWDKKGDSGQTISEPYTIRVISNNLTYRWKANIGNSSQDSIGPNKIRALRTPTDGVEVGNALYFSTGFVEGNTSTFKILKSNLKRMVPIRPSQCGDVDAEVRFCASDSNLVYWAGLDAYSRAWPSTNTTPPDTNSWADCFIYATRVSNDAGYTFSSGTNLKMSLAVCQNYSAIGVSLKDTAATPTGLAVMKNGNYLYLTQYKKGLVKCFNKTTGALIRTISLSLGDISIIDSVVYGVSGNFVKGYKIQSNGNLVANSFSVSINTPLNVSCGNGLVYVTVGSTHQIKAYNTSGVLQWTYGQANGYKSSPLVTNNKFHFIDINELFRKGFTFPCADGSFWVGDAGNCRQLHISSSLNYIENISYLPMSYNASAIKDNPSRVFSSFLEFNADSNKLVANWEGNLKTGYINTSRRNIFENNFVYNNKTFATIQYYPNGFTNDNGRTPEIVQLTDTGIRYTGIRLNSPQNRSFIYSFDKNGDIFRYDYTEATSGVDTIIRKRFKGLNSSNNPTYANDSVYAVVPILANSPIRYCSSSIDSNLVFFSANWANGNYHLGKVKDNKWLWMTSKSTLRGYTGQMPVSDSFDCGNGVEYAGGKSYFVDSFISWNYIGEFWKNSQTNVWKLFHKDGLMLLHFGKTGPQSASISGTSDAPIEAAGNSFAGGMVKSGNKLKVYYNDESRQGAVGSFEISGLNTINTYNISYPLPDGISLDLYDMKIYCLNEDNSMMNWIISETSEYFRYIIEYSDINGNWVKISTIECGKNPIYNEYLLSIPNFNYQVLYRLSVIKYDGTTEVIKIMKSVNCGSEQVIKVYPNPTEDTFKIETPEFMDEYELIILDNLGKVVYSKNCSGWQETVEFENFNEGIYFIRLMSEGNLLYQTKISKIGNNN
jgi:hypothetical protein